MLYRQKFDTFIRIFDEAGYITNKSNFKDQVTDKSGAVFLKALSRNPKTLKEIVVEITTAFKDGDFVVIEQDVKDFYELLEEDGFIVSGETSEELDRKDIRFSYSELMPKTIRKDFTPEIFRADRDTQDYLENHFKNNPHLSQFQIELTSRCNERCAHCYIPHENKTNDIESSLYYSILDQCREMGVLSLTLSGGEPLLHPNFVDFLRKAKEYDFSVNILSNLTLLNDEIVAEMKANRLSSVQVSLYSMNSAIHDSITQSPGSFIKTRDAILKLIENDIPLQISCPVMKQNKNCYVDVAKWAEDHRVRAVTDYIMMARYDHTIGNLDNRLSLDEVGDIIKVIIENDPDYEERLVEADFTEVEKLDLSDEIICGVCISSICMVANGNIYPCAGWQNYICGNVTKQSLKEIWERSPKIQYLRGLRKKDMPECMDCADRHFCAVCMVRNANEDPEGNPLKINRHFCKVAALNRKIVLDWKEQLQATQ
ncbi:MAG: radical SAM protein [Prevotellaceae bacterium]|jgi:radical SAM protein with 4Fe4S-binding SPASM domain|nr:radical SAM protein [Prevotellaceae bacterium]